MHPSQGEQLGAQRRKKFYRTRECKFHQAGRCSFGDECRFAHGTSQLRQQPDLYKSELCTHFTFTGSCDRGEACRFAHFGKELRKVANKTACSSQSSEALPQADGKVFYLRNTPGKQAVNPAPILRRVAFPQAEQTTSPSLSEVNCRTVATRCVKDDLDFCNRALPPEIFLRQRT